ncbi:PspA/IM30 family protein [Sulfoacidibacillus thermotolerans]|uniref:Phage shock protein A n=1 Tax=Sulfoacidibacillus thermotolerans TaxID=1765684 RepID=A0A2U3D9W6_SULT2|nr:PspA/IM30 family protein [Sulfoacidibacillus thermotolerans]PWI58066.1 hypothetical protein BM613_05205 [Sulfoacidibacillus thermotolerans]
MGLFKRVAKIVQASVEERNLQQSDPRDQLQAVFQDMLVQVGEVKRLIGEVAAYQVRLEHELKRLEESMADYETQAKEALEQGDEPRAREHLRKRQSVKNKFAATSQQEQMIRRKLEQLRDAKNELSEQVQAFREARDEAQMRLAAANGALAIQTALTLANDAKSHALEQIQDEARVAEARIEVTESIDQEFDRLLRETQRKP